MYEAELTQVIFF